MFKPLPLNRATTRTLDLYFGELLVGSFTGRYADVTAPSVKLALARRNRALPAKDQQRIRMPKCEADIEFAHELSVDFFLDQDVLTAWQIEGADGEPVPFTRANLKAFFTSPDYRWAFGEVDRFFTDEANFAEPTRADALGE